MASEAEPASCAQVRGTLYAGTSGFAYKTWKPDFYPADLKAADMLRHYAARLPSVEINNTFYRMPTEKVLSSWRPETPATFALTLKAPQRITHVGRLKDVGDPLAYFLRAAGTLGTRLGCILFQCPPSLRYDAAILDGFLGALPAEGMRFAMEFRHPSWLDGGARAKLAARDVAWCSVDSEEDDASPERTARGFVYARLRKPHYDRVALDRWAGALRTVLADGADAYVYFKHEDDPAGVEYARTLISSV
jgi:uncharacterized protein YecE (DUF72 family)